MEMTRPCYAVVYVILLCALAKRGSEGKRFNLHQHHAVFSSNSLHIHQQKAAQVWKHCLKEIIDRNNDIKDFDLHLFDRTVEKDIHRATKFLPHHMKQHFLDCISNRNHPSPVSEEQGHLLKKHYESHFGLERKHRYLLSDSDLSSGSSPKTNSQIHAAVKATSTPPSPDNTFGGLPLPLDMRVPPSPPPPPPAPPPPVFDPIHNERHRKAIIAAASASGIIILIGLLLCCNELRRNKKVNRDDRPSLILSSSEMSASSKPVGLGNSNMGGSSFNNGRNPSIARNLSIRPEHNNASLAESTSSDTDGKGKGISLSLSRPPSRRRLSPEAPSPSQPPPPPPALAPRPPPPPKGVRAPPAPPKPMAGRNQHSPLGEGSDSDVPKPKLKPFFWDKVATNPDQAMVWHEIRSGSFQFSEEKIESLFGCSNQNRNERRKDSPSLEPAVQYIQIIDPKKAQNLSILLRALNVSTEEVVDALNEGNEIPVELIQTLLKMAPTTDEELKLRLFTGDVSQLGPAERFLKVLVDIPFAFKRLESLLFMFTLSEEASNIKDSFTTLEVSCNTLRKSRLFQKLLEAVLKTGNRMNDGTYRGGAQAFRLDTLLKLADVKGTDGKITLLHFVVQEIIRSEGIRAVRTEKASQSPAYSVKTDDSIDDSSGVSEDHYRSLGLQVVSGLSSELEDVKKAAVIDGDALTAAVAKLNISLEKTEAVLNTELKDLEEESEFQHSLESFLVKAKREVSWLMEEEKRIMAEVKSTADYFHGNAGKDEGLRLFAIVRDFLLMLDKVCKEVKLSTKTVVTGSCKKEPSSVPSSPDTRQPSPNMHRRLFPAIAERRIHGSSSDDYDDDDDDDEMLST